jgi:multicomponent Na+:H+ antiporter subunit D
VFLHAGIKFPWFVFFQRDSGLRPKDAPWNMAAAMVFFSLLCILFGVAPELLYRYLPYPVDYQAYTASKVVFYLQLLLFSGLAFFLLLPLMRRTETISLDTDWLWRVALLRGAAAVRVLLQRAGAVLGRGADSALARVERKARAWFGGTPEDDGRPHGVFARAWPIGTTALWIAVLLTAYVFFYYLG